MPKNIAVKITKANVKDAPVILELQKLCFKSEAELYRLASVPPMMETLQEFKAEFKTHVFLKAIKGKRIIGSLRTRTRGKSIYIGRVIVHPDFQNQGLGTKLMQAVENMFQKAGRYWLMTGFKSKRNLHLYTKLGYKVFKTKQYFKNIKMVYMEKYR
jgi:ribosomal protein S18 acetylase RimI-like enzyme